MSQGQLLALLAGAGLGTYALRYLPMRWYIRLQPLFEKPILRTTLSALGPAAIVALLVVSLAGLVDFDVQHGQSDILRIVIALVAVWLGYRFSKNTIVATFVGVVVYGVIISWQMT